MNTVILLSGGVGRRTGSSVPKQYIEINGRMMIYNPLSTILNCNEISHLQIVAAEPWHNKIRKIIDQICEKRVVKTYAFSEPGVTRQLSIFHALKDLNDRLSEDDFVLIHDAARPFVTVDLLNKTLDTAQKHDGAIPVLPVSDTIYWSMDGKSLSGCIPREQIYAGQAPEAFRFGPYLRANESLLPEQIRTIKGSTEPALLAGLDMAVLPGDPGNFKVTTFEDLERAKQILSKATT